MKSILLSITLLFTLGFSSYAQQQSQPQPEIFAKNGIAINGYDVVAYFTQGEPVKGVDSFSFNWNHANWYFSNQANLDLFKADPTKYTPQFGGYCAFGLSRGYKAPTQADAWSIVDGKLYLNYNVEVRKIWSKDSQQFIDKAKTNWLQLKHSDN